MPLCYLSMVDVASSDPDDLLISARCHSTRRSEDHRGCQSIKSACQSVSISSGPTEVLGPGSIPSPGEMGQPALLMLCSHCQTQLT